MSDEVKIEIGSLLVFKLRGDEYSRIGLAVERSYKYDIYDKILNTSDIPSETDVVWKIFWIRDSLNKASVFGYYTEMTLYELFYGKCLYIYK